MFSCLDAGTAQIENWMGSTMSTQETRRLHFKKPSDSSASCFCEQRGEASPRLGWLTSLPEHALVGFPGYVLGFTDKTQQLLFSQESDARGTDIPVAQSAAVTGDVRRWWRGSHPRLDPV